MYFTVHELRAQAGFSGCFSNTNLIFSGLQCRLKLFHRKVDIILPFMCKTVLKCLSRIVTTSQSGYYSTYFSVFIYTLSSFKTVAFCFIHMFYPELRCIYLVGKTDLMQILPSNIVYVLSRDA